jgi:hypothetical protein
MGRNCLLIIATKENDGEDIQIILEGVEAYRATYYNARSLEMVQAAYDELVDMGETDWLHEINGRMTPGEDRPGKLYHMLINFDDGPCYEFICRSFQPGTVPPTAEQYDAPDTFASVPLRHL